MTEMKPVCWFVDDRTIGDDEYQKLRAESGADENDFPVFTSAQLTAAREEARGKALEEASKVADHAFENYNEQAQMCSLEGHPDRFSDGLRCFAMKFAREIRALKSAKGEK